jgi:hypothetical protein
LQEGVGIGNLFRASVYMQEITLYTVHCQSLGEATSRPKV